MALPRSRWCRSCSCIRRTKLDLVGLYQQKGPYQYWSGWNPVAILALLAGIAPNLPGFLGTVKLVAVPKFWMDLYHYTWFVGFGISFAVYVGLTVALRRAKRAPA